MLRGLRLYYPNSWRRCVSDLKMSKEQYAFNWFMCGKRYKDTRSGMYVVKLSVTAKFYDPHTGHTLSPSRETEIMLPGGLPITEEILKLYDYGGYAETTRCDLKNPVHFPLCHDVSFSFLDGVLEVVKKENVCELVVYSKTHNEVIRNVVPSFPDAAMIDEAIKTKGCAEVCKRLHTLLLEYQALV